MDPEAIQRHLPSRFRPKLQAGQAVAGICLIRLEQLRPKMFPEIVGLSSENAAHRVAVLWEDESGSTHEGVYIPRRDTNSPVNLLLGGRAFPGEHHSASFAVRESDEEVSVRMKARDGSVAVEVAGRIAEALPDSSIFPSVGAASSFFEAGSLDYCATHNANRLEGLKLQTEDWRVEALDVNRVNSSWFADEKEFPKGSVEFDHALLMRNIAHEWHNASELYF